MNRAQKAAWCNLIGSFISMALLGLCGYVLLSGPTAEKFHALRYSVFALSAIMVVVFILFFAFIFRKKQSSAEPDADERDRQISKKAVQVMLVAMCVLFFFATALPMWMYGLDSSIPVVALPLINLAVFLVALTVYNAAVLILYRIQGGAA